MSDCAPQLQALSAFSDNYIWMLSENGRAWVVDPGDAKPVQEVLAVQHLALAGILLTHHHGDHSGGVAELCREWSVPVYGAANSGVASLVTQVVADGDTVNLGDCQFSVLAVPGHTLDHLAFHCSQQRLLFCGDTLFSAGCGRVFEGTPAQMHASLQRLAALPDDTRVCCAHEYTLGNLRFACEIEPANPLLQQYLQHCRQCLAQGEATLPALLGTEKAVNPFLRTDVADVRAAAERHVGCPLPDAVAVFAALREWKNDF